LIFFFFNGCQIDSQELKIELEEIRDLSQIYGFGIEKINTIGSSQNKINFENLHEYELFLDYLRKSYNNSVFLEFDKIEEIFLKNGIEFDNLMMSKNGFEESETQVSPNSNRIQCIPNAQLVTARVRNMPFPGLPSGLNGVEIGIELQNGNLVTSSTTWGMYGIYPFLNVRGGQITQVQSPSFSNNYTTTLSAQYTVVWYSMVGENSFANFARMKVSIKVDACSGRTEVLFTEL
jgi:hypothetical protein